MPTSRPDLSAGTSREARSGVALHPLVVWAWAAAVGLAASRTRNVVLLLSLLAGLGVVVWVARERTRAPSSRVFAAFLRLAIAIVVLRIVFGVVFGTGSTGGQVLFDLPQLVLPDWVAGIRLGGPVTSAMLGQSVADGLWLGTVLACVGAATAVADPADLLRAVPGALYELGVSVVVALSFTPRLIDDAVRARQARRLRGQSMRGVRAWNRTALGVLEGGLDQAVTLAASMDARGYGRMGPDGATHRRPASACMLAGIVATGVGILGLLGLSLPAGIAFVLLVVGIGSGTIGMVLGGRGRRRSRYRRLEFGLAELLVLVGAAVLAAAFLAAATDATPGLQPAGLTLSPVPVVPWVACVLVLTPALVVLGTRPR
jgi:energy-coupling factor transport system permease protein